MKRVYESVLKEHFLKERKMAFVAGPRQVGKTTTARESLPGALYLNWDNIEHKEIILQGPSRIFAAAGGESLHEGKVSCIFDEIHKFDRWKTFLKGFFDTYADKVDICVTGSGRLDLFKHGGDSLMGRYFLYHMHPLTVREIVNPSTSNGLTIPPAPIENSRLNMLYTMGGFPEPCLREDSRFYNRWKRLRTEQLFEEDLRDITRITDVSRMKILASRLARSIGGTISYSNLSTDIMVSVDTVRRWIDVLESVYYCFRIRPYIKDVARSILKEPKIFLWDWALAESEGARTENFVASHLFKMVQFLNDGGYGEYGLFYLRDKDKREVDFVVTRDAMPWFLVEVKSGDEPISPSLRHFQQKLRVPHAFQVTRSMPFVDSDCFAHPEPVKVPMMTFLSQLAA
jgi:predicted AAA+ superfamily ATPase